MRVTSSQMRMRVPPMKTGERNCAATASMLQRETKIADHRQAECGCKSTLLNALDGD